MNLDDTQIMLRVQAGEVELFETLFVRYRGPLLNAALNQLGDRDWAEDVVQEAFLAAYSARGTYRPEFAFRTWIWTILLNLCRRQWARRERCRASNEPLHVSTAEYVEPPASHETGLSRVLEIERQKQVLELLGDLPETQAAALRLRFFGGLKFAEIALAMDSSVGAAKMRVKQGLLRLLQRYRELEGDSP